MAKKNKSEKSNSNNNSNNNTNNTNNTNNNTNNTNNTNNNNNNNNIINNSNNNNSNNNNNNSNNNNNNLNNNNNNSNNNNNNLNNSNNSNNNNTNNNNLTNNEKINKFVNDRKNDLKKVKKMTDNFKNNLNAMPLQLKIFNIILCCSFTYIFTNVYYKLWVSILFALVTSVFLYMYLGLYFALIFLTMYAVVLIKIINENNKSAGIIIKQTNIYETSDKKAFPCDVNKPENNIVASNRFRNEVDNRDFTICLFLYVNGSNPTYKNNYTNYRYRDWKSVFYLGNNEIKENSEDKPEEIKNLKQLPGLWLKPSLNNLVLVIKDGQNNERLELDNIPLNEWFSVSIIINSASVSLYQNCKLEKIVSLRNIIPDTSQYNLYLTNDSKLIKYQDGKERNGFGGQMAFFTYYNYVLSQKQINSYCNAYKDALNKYQYKENQNIKYETSCLVTDSDNISL